MSVAATPALVDLESRQWLRDLRADGATADKAVARLHGLLLRAATFEVTRRQAVMPHVRADIDAVALKAADDALIRVRACLDDYRGESRFTTWASKFALQEAAVELRRRAWQGRELPTAPVAVNIFAGLGTEPAAAQDQRRFVDTLQDGIGRLNPHQRDILVALALNEVPIDVLAERRGITRGALYRTLHDARVKLRLHMAAAGLAVN
jgi:RNA polymerase sigma-70 factor, ECF subfamily